MDKEALSKPLPCQCLRSKEMYYQEDGHAEDLFTSDTFWCTKTLENFGPDGDEADSRECGPGRSCYKG
jgi:hypothetical protein